jgi:hypothetical protein
LEKHCENATGKSTKYFVHYRRKVMKNKKNTKGCVNCAALATLLLSVTALSGCMGETADINKENNPKAAIVTDANKAIAVEIPATQNQERGNASGQKIPSGAHSDAFPGIIFVWDSKATDSGYLLAAAEVFDVYGSFTLTAKEGDGYWDFVIKPAAGQQKSEGGDYVFLFPVQAATIKLTWCL